MPEIADFLGPYGPLIGIGVVVAAFALRFKALFCGTLMTPLAANFNIVPAASLELKNRNGVIIHQIPTALAMLAINTMQTYALAFRCVRESYSQHHR